jgi:hypothetical protein
MWPFCLTYAYSHGAQQSRIVTRARHAMLGACESACLAVALLFEGLQQVP